jgi:hypothetical protein
MACRGQYISRTRSIFLFFNFMKHKLLRSLQKCEGTLMVNLSMRKVVFRTIFHLERHMGPSYSKPTFTFKKYYLVDYNIYIYWIVLLLFLILDWLLIPLVLLLERTNYHISSFHLMRPFDINLERKWMYQRKGYKSRFICYKSYVNRKIHKVTLILDSHFTP